MSSTSPTSPEVGTLPILELVHQLLGQDETQSWPLDRVVTEIGQAMNASASGLAELASGNPIFRYSSREGAVARFPWNDSAEVLAQVRDAWTGVALTALDRSWLLVPGASPAGTGGWLLWVEAGTERIWSAAERAALNLAAQVLARAVGGEAVPRWNQQLDRIRRQQRLEDAARVAQRLAHDYGNVLTTLLGFSELSLGVPDPGKPLSMYLSEINRASQQGSQLTDQLRLFSRRGLPGPRSADAGRILVEETGRLRRVGGLEVDISLDVAADLPPVFMTEDLTRRVMQELLANAHEALTGKGQITASARVAELAEAECFELFGAAVPGPALEIRIADTGCGLSAEARHSLLSTLFFTTKPRHRGLGLATVYGILRSHGGGFRLDPRSGGGVAVVVVLPLAARPAVAVADPKAGTTLGPAAADRVRERVLVVDDDPMVLRLVTTTLERDGYQVQTAQGGAEALRRYTASNPEPFRLVLTDVLMPFMSGVDLARKLVQHDASVNLMFMSGQVGADFHPANWGGMAFPLINKPFRPEGLLQAVRTALDRDRSGHAGRPANRPTLLSTTSSTTPPASA